MALVANADEAGWALRRGASILQLRIPGGPGRALEKEARAIIPTAIVPVLISSRIDVALAVGAALAESTSAMAAGRVRSGAIRPRWVSWGWRGRCARCARPGTRAGRR